jgi:hypothetical protein
MAVADVPRLTPSVQPIHICRTVGIRFNNHTNLINPGGAYDHIMSQIHSLVKRSKRKHTTLTTVTVKRIRFTVDIWDFITLHRINYNRLADIKWVPMLKRWPDWIREMAKTLHNNGVASGIGNYDNVPERHLIVLDSDDVPNDDLWKYLHEANDRVHKTGPDPRRRTVVFTSFALLGNAVRREDFVC